MEHSRKLFWTSLFVVAVLCRTALAQPATSALPADDAAAAWAKVEPSIRTLSPPPEWRTQPPKPEEVAAFQKKLIESAHKLVGDARDFLRRFPTNENAGDARFMVVFALNHALAAGENSAEKEARDFVDATLADPGIPEDDKAKIFMLSASLGVMKKFGMNFFIEGEQ